jgi:hypothetical protein
MIRIESHIGLRGPFTASDRYEGGKIRSMLLYYSQSLDNELTSYKIDDLSIFRGSL